MLQDLKNDIVLLISEYEKVKKENDNIKAELQQDRELIGTYKKQINELENKIDNLKLRSAFLANSGDEEAKERIDRLLKEIDRCIALLEG